MSTCRGTTHQGILTSIKTKVKRSHAAIQTNILITGDTRFIDSHVVRLFMNKYPRCRIINLDKLTYAENLANLKGHRGERKLCIHENGYLRLREDTGSDAAVSRRLPYQ